VKVKEFRGRYTYLLPRFDFDAVVRLEFIDNDKCAIAAAKADERTCEKIGGEMEAPEGTVRARFLFEAILYGWKRFMDTSNIDVR